MRALRCGTTPLDDAPRLRASSQQSQTPRQQGSSTQVVLVSRASSGTSHNTSVGT